MDVSAYALNGNGQERKATKEEMEMVINDDFPYNYDGATLSCINHDGPDQFIVRNKGGSRRLADGNV
ncbi:hypothetical protein HNQ56_001666 [Anaerotaenia torta]|uniref:hypothetical protein n=1 Tax=Anaerotaenia torta TaxID=433293 RepID=UPI003D22C3F9